MNALRRRLFAAALLLLAVLLTPANIFSCGPFFEVPVFTNQEGPDRPLELFAQGRMGIILPTYERRYLVVAYRYLSGKPLTKAEATAVAEAWEPKPTPQGQPSPDEVAVNKWEQARSAVLGEPSTTVQNMNRFRQLPDSPWVEYPNCGNDAFVTAAQTLTTLAQKFGVRSAPVRDWVQAQDAVFQNCSGTDPGQEVKPHLPAPAAGLQDAVLRMDRQYQIAAANFYAGDFHSAAKQFQQIADDGDSQWRVWAPYLVARCYIREATLNVASSNDPRRDPAAPSYDVEKMTLAEKQLQSILKDPALAAVHPASQKLLNYVEARLHPDQRLREVAQQLEGSGPASDFVQNLIDFNWLLNHRFGRSDDGTLKPDATPNAGLDDLTNWVVSFQQPSPEALRHAVERWRATKSEAWLMAALSMTRAADSNAGTLADAAAAVTPNSPAYEMAVYYRARLLLEQTKQDAARQLLDANLPRFEKGPLSAFNLLLGQRFAVAGDFRQFLEYAPRTPVTYAYDDCDDCGAPDSDATRAKPLPKRLEIDSARIFNERLPLSLLSQASAGQVLPPELRGEIGTATWSRAAILADPATAKSLEPLTVEAHPELRDYIKAYDDAASDDARTFAATWMMLHFPGMRPFVFAGAFRETKFAAIDNFRDNWWCGEAFVKDNLGGSTLFYDNQPPIDSETGKKAEPKPPPFPSFLTPTERTSTEEQWHKLSSLPAAPEYMGGVVLDWATSHADDPRLPEALHLVVRATRYGCSDEKTGAISKQAYDLLHTRYPNSSWAKQTPYWYK